MPEPFNRRCPKCGNPGGYINCTKCMTGNDLSIRPTESIYEQHQEDAQEAEVFQGKRPLDTARGWISSHTSTSGPLEERAPRSEQAGEEGKSYSDAPQVSNPEPRYRDEEKLFPKDLGGYP